jgi:hypothetical protein
MVPRADVNLMPRHVPPSRIRYEKKNPKVSVRLTESVRKVLDERKKREGLSYADIIKKVLKAAADEEKAYKKGWSEAMAEFMITVPCSVCKKPIPLRPGSEMHKDAIEHLAGWHHGECVEKPG